MRIFLSFWFFFFQAEDGIRDDLVTGVQTCALPICLVQSQTGDQFNQIYPGGISSNISLNYVTVPVFLTFKPVPELSILAGPQYGFLVAQTTGLFPQGKNNSFSKSDFSIAFGGQLNLGKVKFGLRYVVGLFNINGINNSDTWKIQGLQAYLGYSIK